MRVAVFVNSLSCGGTEKAACYWAGALSRFGHEVFAVSLADGPRRADLARSHIPLRIPQRSVSLGDLASCIEDADVIHAHAPGFAHEGDVLGSALRFLGRSIPVVQTNVFGQLRNSADEHWVNYRLFVSWTSCVQAARRSGKRLDRDFFRRQSVAVYPVADPTRYTNFDLARESAVELRKSLGISEDKILFGRFSRPEPNKWTPLALDAFLSAYITNSNIRLLLREPPADVVSALCSRGLAAWGEKATANVSYPVLCLRSTSDAEELAGSQLACDAILHTSSIGESFGYAIAEPMALGRPVITHSVPWHDQAQLELVQHGECGLVANNVRAMTDGILQLAADKHKRVRYGERSRERILRLADPAGSAAKLESAMRCAVEGRDNPNIEEDLIASRQAASNLDHHQWGHTLDEYCYLRGTSAKISFLRWQRRLRDRLNAYYATLA